MTSETPRSRTSPTNPKAAELATAIGQRGHRWLAPDADTPPRPPFTEYATEHTYAGEPDAETADGADVGIGTVGIGFGIGRCDCPIHSRIRAEVREANRRSSGDAT
ncbi:hypothetical protein ACFQ7B_00445 [Streptomyces erythrochromogenes]|uniref:hypothetical protein n=1 Tax=Streptomyces erythrochromogenes TaxID=285574 RepID=UPI0036CFEA59